MKLRALPSALRNSSLPALIGEAAWRSIRSIRRTGFRLEVSVPSAITSCSKNMLLSLLSLTPTLSCEESIHSWDTVAPNSG
jgi:hypothetical protein